MLSKMKLGLFFCLVFFHQVAYAHDFSASANYLGNEGVMVEENGVAVLFDPFFHRDYSQYTLVPKKLRQDIFEQNPPFDKVKLVLVSHAHGDHFDKDDVVKYLLANTQAKLIAPNDAVDQIQSVAGFKKIADRVIAIDIEKGAEPKLIKSDSIQVEAVRIPHAGWPRLAELSNIVYRVQMDQQTTVMHMGDADADPNHFAEQGKFWKQKNTDSAFPPFWFALSAGGQTILKDYVKAKQVINVHVPTQVPDDLKATGSDYFSKPGESRQIKSSHKHD